MCQVTILWVQLCERGHEKEIKLDAAAFCCHELLDGTFMQVLQHFLALFFSIGNVEEILPAVKHSSTSKVNFPQGKPEQIQGCQTQQKQK